MHIFTANIPTFHSGYRRYVLITNEYHELCWSIILGTSDDEKASYGPKSMHIFNMSKIRHSHREYDTRGWCGTKPGPNRSKVGPTAPLHGWPARCWCFSSYTLPTCQGRSVHGVSNAQSQCGQETWLPGHPSWPGSLTSGPPEPHFRPKHRLNPHINTPIILSAKSVKKVRFSFL
jgi:hypothetical protein